MILRPNRVLAMGVSALAINAAVPAWGGTQAGIGQTTTQADVNSTLTISQIGDDFTFGVDDTGTTATANVNNVATGQVTQSASATGVGAGLGDANIVLTNDGSVTVQALAEASNAAGAATADADIQTGFLQVGIGVASATPVFDNNGSLAVAATATAVASDGADANAYVGTGIYQSASAGTMASATLNNPASSGIVISALADEGYK